MLQPPVLFKLSNAFAMAGWLFLVFLPGRRITRRLIFSGAWSLFIAVAYLVFFVTAVISGGPDIDMGSLEGVTRIFSNGWGLLTGWVHYLCFDLLIGAWEVQDARKHKIPHMLVLPCLFFTFMLGPIGFLMYWIIRLAYLRKLNPLF